MAKCLGSGASPARGYNPPEQVDRGTNVCTRLARSLVQANETFSTCPMNNETNDPVDQEDDGDRELVALIRGSRSSDTIVSTTLQTDDRVIARVTDGIYRRPGSALRELISNAYDADATRVVITTDAPRFKRISVEDNGHGMSPEALAYLLLHIGGSAKRHHVGAELGIASTTDPTRSPNGRRLIGKIGIGLFSVSQLTYTFQIITKVSGDDFRTIATVALRQYSEDDSSGEHIAGRRIETGRVRIWRERALDVDISGTTLVLTNIRPQARDSLRSAEVWSALDLNASVGPTDERQDIEPPAFHIGRLDTADSSEQLLKESHGCLSRVPWQESDSPATAFAKLVSCVWEEVEGTNPNPQLAQIFDNYLRMVWQLSLAVPLPYVDQHLFDMDMRSHAQTYLLSNDPKGSAVPAETSRPGRIRDSLQLTEPAEGAGAFDVFFDNLQLSRPIRFTGLPATSHALRQPIVFIGKCREEFPDIAREFSGGPLAFEAYLFWTPKVAPTEHQGSLIRIHGSSGTLFDPTFMRYQVSEQTRLRQITCEIFVSEGLDSALNIDRESFNAAHPHSVYITKWLHGALRQLATVQKRLASEARERTRGESKHVALSEIQQVALNVWAGETEDVAASPPAVELSAPGDKKSEPGEAYVFRRASVIVEKEGRKTAALRGRTAILEEKIRAVAQILAAFGLLDALPKPRQEKLLKAIYEILQAGSE